MTTQRPKPPQIDVLLPSVGVATVPPQPSYPGRQRKPRAPRILQHAMPPVKERDVLAPCRQYLALKGWSHWRHQAGPLSPLGFPDVVAIKRGVVLWIEVKSPTGTLSGDQKDFRAEIQRQGGHYLEVHSLEDLIREIEVVQSEVPA